MRTNCDQNQKINARHWSLQEKLIASFFPLLFFLYTIYMKWKSSFWIVCLSNEQWITKLFEYLYNNFFL